MREILCVFSDFSPKNQFKIHFTVHWLRNTYKFFFVYLLYFCARASVRPCVRPCVRPSVRAFFFWRQDVWVYCYVLSCVWLIRTECNFCQQQTPGFLLIDRQVTFFHVLKSGQVFLVINRQASNFFSCFEVWRGISCLFIINKRSIEGDNIRLERYFLLIIERQVTFFHVLKSGEVFLVVYDSSERNAISVNNKLQDLY